jgi:hypothetical protein
LFNLQLVLAAYQADKKWDFNLYRTLRDKLSINKNRFGQPGKKSEGGVTIHRGVSE